MRLQTPSLNLCFDIFEALHFIEATDVESFRSVLGEPVCPVALVGQDVLYMGSDGRCVLPDGIGVGYCVFSDFSSALNRLVLRDGPVDWFPYPDDDSGAGR